MQKIEINYEGINLKNIYTDFTRFSIHFGYFNWNFFSKSKCLFISVAKILLIKEFLILYSFEQSFDILLKNFKSGSQSIFIVVAAWFCSKI